MNRRALAVGVTSFAGVLSCSTAPDAPGTTLTVDGVPSCGSCRLEVAERVSLGSMEDSVSPAELVRGVVAPDGTILIVSDRLPMPGALRYSSAGEFIGTLGRAGKGPGEFTWVRRLAAGPEDVYLQGSRGLLHVFDAQGEFRRIVRGIPVTSARLAVVDRSYIAVVSRSSRPAEAPDRSVHLYDLSSGAYAGAVGPRSYLDLERPPDLVRVAPSASGGLWVVRPPLQAELWMRDGTTPDVQIAWDPAWLGQVRDAYDRPATEDDVLLDMEVWEDSDRGLLWVMAFVSEPGAGPPFPSAEPGAPLPDDRFSPRRLRGVINTIVSVVDLDDGSVLAYLELDGAASHFLGDGRLLMPRENAVGYQWIEVVRLQLRR